MVVSCSTSLDLRGVAVAKSILVLIHQVRFVDQLVSCFKLRGVVTTNFKLEMDVLLYCLRGFFLWLTLRLWVSVLTFSRGLLL